MMSIKRENILEITKLSTPALDEGLDYSVTGYEKCLPPVKKLTLNTDMITSLQLTYTSCCILVLESILQVKYLV